VGEGDSRILYVICCLGARKSEDNKKRRESYPPFKVKQYVSFYDPEGVAEGAGVEGAGVTGAGWVTEAGTGALEGCVVRFLLLVWMVVSGFAWYQT